MPSNITRGTLGRAIRAGAEGFIEIPCPPPLSITRSNRPRFQNIHREFRIGENPPLVVESTRLNESEENDIHEEPVRNEASRSGTNFGVLDRELDRVMNEEANSLQRNARLDRSIISDIHTNEPRNTSQSFSSVVFNSNRIISIVDNALKNLVYDPVKDGSSHSFYEEKVSMYVELVSEIGKEYLYKKVSLRTVFWLDITIRDKFFNFYNNRRSILNEISLMKGIELSEKSLLYRMRDCEKRGDKHKISQVFAISRSRSMQGTTDHTPFCVFNLCKHCFKFKAIAL